ncbi:MAG: hypothetical protein WC848_01450 [Parcubacteria group bacterium]|jgi:hypothetical protein
MAKSSLEKLSEKARDSLAIEAQLNDKFEAEIIEFFSKSIGIDEADYKAINFVSMLIFFCEKNIEKVCADFIKRGAIVVTPQVNGMMEYAFEELTFTQKINIYEKLLKKYFSENKKLIKGASFYREINAIRNKIFHCKFKDIRYRKKYAITEYETRKMLLEDMIKAHGIELPKDRKSARELAAQEYKRKK